MRQRLGFCLSMALSMAVGGGASWAAEPVGAGPRTWTSQAGTTVEAEFVALQDGMVILRPTAGGELRIRPGDLSAEDQAIVTTLAPTVEKTAPAATPAKAGKMDARQLFVNPSPDHYDPKTRGPVLKTFDFPDYTALVLEKGAVFIYVKENGAYRSHPIEAFIFARYEDPTIKEWRSRPVTSVAAPPEIGQNQILLHLNLADGLEGKLWAQFQPTEIQFGYQLIEPKDIDPPCLHRWLRVQIPAYYRWEPNERLFISPRFPDGLDLPAATARLAEADVRFTSQKRQVRAYAEPTRALPNDNRRVEILGPVFTDKTITFESPGKNTELNAWIYADKSPADGFLIYLNKSKPESPPDNRNERVTLTIE